LSLSPQARRLGQTPAEVLTRQQLEVGAGGIVARIGGGIGQADRFPLK
jgi:hypothetical protein